MSSHTDLIINFTPTGMIPTKEMTPHVPISVGEIVEDVLRAYELGITIVHLHARNSLTGKPDYKAEIYGEIIENIRREAPDLILCTSLSGRNFREFEKRSEPLELEGSCKPDMGSLTLSSTNFNREASVNSPDMIKALAHKMKERKIKPELEAFDTGMINYAKYLAKKGFIDPPFYFNLILGNIACAQADLMHPGLMLRELPRESYWSLGGIGSSQLPMNTIAIAQGGGVRIGLEDNYWYDKKRSRLATNLDLLKRIHNIAQACERTVMKPSRLRELLGLQPGYGKYGVLKCSEMETDHTSPGTA